MKKLAAFLCLTSAVLFFSGVTPAWVDETSREFEGKWIGEGPGDLCFGDSKIYFTVKNGVLEGTWYRGVARANAATVNFNAKINRSNKISGYIGENTHLFKIYGRFDGEIARGTISSGQEPSKCSSFWTAKRIDREKREQERVTKDKREQERIAREKREAEKDEVVSASSGSGFAVSSDGHVITNNHVIDGCQRVQIHHKGKSIPATIVTFDPNNDLALLQGDFRPSTVFALSKEKPELLQDIYVAGYPFGQRISTSVKVTKGIISSLTGIGNNFSNIQIDAALQPGNSGGPILNDKGNVVGVAVAKLDIKKVLEDWGVIPEDTNFGIKTSVVRNLLESNDISLPNPNTKSISKSKLGKMITEGTYYLSCWMTYAQIEKLRTEKVMFKDFQ